MKYFITLVSEQAIPNVQYIKEFGPFDAYFFVTTDIMESSNKTSAITNALGVDVKLVRKIIVKEDDLNNITTKIRNYVDPIISEILDAEWIVNCTLGTKLMSIGLFDVFKSVANAILLYTPI